MANEHRRTPANDNPLWPWHGVCEACGANMGPVRNSRLCRDCLLGEPVASTPEEDALWAMLLEEQKAPAAADPDTATGPRW